MNNRPTFLALILLFALALPTAAEDSPGIRFKAYMAALDKATTFAQIKPFFTATAWEGAFGEFGSLAASEQSGVLDEMRKEFKGSKILSESVKDGQATLSIGAKKDKQTPVLMIKQNGVWVIDG